MIFFFFWFGLGGWGLRGEYNNFYFQKKWMVKCYASKLQQIKIDLYQITNHSLSLALTLLTKIVNDWFHSRFSPGVFKVPLSLLLDNDIVLREDNAAIYGVMLPVKALPLKSKISKLLKFAISTRKIDDSMLGETI